MSVPSSELWLPPPVQQANLSLPRNQRGGGDTLACGWGSGGSQFGRLKKKPSTLSTLWSKQSTRKWEISLSFPTVDYWPFHISLAYGFHHFYANQLVQDTKTTFIGVRTLLFVFFVLYLIVLRIRDVYPVIFSSRDTKAPDPGSGSATKNLGIFNPENCY